MTKKGARLLGALSISEGRTGLDCPRQTGMFTLRLLDEHPGMQTDERGGCRDRRSDSEDFLCTLCHLAAP